MIVVTLKHKLPRTLERKTIPATSFQIMFFSDRLPTKRPKRCKYVSTLSVLARAGDETIAPTALAGADRCTRIRHGVLTLAPLLPVIGRRAASLDYSPATDAFLISGARIVPNVYVTKGVSRAPTKHTTHRLVLCCILDW